MVAAAVHRTILLTTAAAAVACFVGLTASASVAATPTTLVVATNGNDGNAGTLAHFGPSSARSTSPAPVPRSWYVAARTR